MVKTGSSVIEFVDVIKIGTETKLTAAEIHQILLAVAVYSSLKETAAEAAPKLANKMLTTSCTE